MLPLNFTVNTKYPLSDHIDNAIYKKSIDEIFSLGCLYGYSFALDKYLIVIVSQDNTTVIPLSFPEAASLFSDPMTVKGKLSSFIKAINDRDPLESFNWSNAPSIIKAKHLEVILSLAIEFDPIIQNTNLHLVGKAEESMLLVAAVINIRLQKTFGLYFDNYISSITDNTEAALHDSADPLESWLTFITINDSGIPINNTIHLENEEKKSVH